MSYLIWTVLGYLSGSVLYARLLPKLFCGVDVCAASDDGNPGAANAFKYGGIAVGLAVILCELAKGFLPVFLAGGILDRRRLLFFPVMAAPVIGHAFPFLKSGEGGKAIAVSFGVMIGLYPEVRPLLLLIFFYLLFSLVIVIRPHFYRSVITFALFCAGCFLWLGNETVSLGCAAVSAVVVGKHFARFHGEKFSVAVGRTLKRECGNKDIG